jgi:hypothetical protein
VPPELVGAFNLIFYKSAEDAVFKALGVEWWVTVKCSNIKGTDKWIWKSRKWIKINNIFNNNINL